MPPDVPTRRDFLTYATTATALVGVGLGLWPFIATMNPAADVLALSTTEIDLTPIAEGQRLTVTWRGKPVFVAHRTAAEIAQARAGDAAALPDPERDTDRVKRPEWLIVVGVCTHLGCIPQGQKPADTRGEMGGWFCPCHGSVYDTSARIRRGPAPKNLEVPPYRIAENNTVVIG
ncbi:MAG: ubiquinol-cytochrome c reductase iron-sulfur subunit [Rhodospirillales bacterium]|nr:ubiquinol-cytochrome c reductase iron-sulfur subunit [Rhodospirillales bacterium]